MVFTALSQEIVPALNALVSSKQVINFTVEDDVLKLQGFEPIINNKTVKLCRIDDASGSNSISVKLDGSFNLLEPGEVIFAIDDDSLLISSPDYRSRFKSLYEERFMNSGKVTETRDVYLNTFGHISRIAQGMSGVAASIGVDAPAVIFKDGNAYMILSNIMWRTNALFYDCILPISHIRAINKSLTKSKYQMQLYGEEKNYASIKYNDTSEICFPIRRDNSETISTIEGIVSGLKKVGSTTIASLSEQLKVVEKIYKNEPIVMDIGEKGFRVELAQNTTSFLSIGKQTSSNILATVRSSVPVLSLIHRVFGESTFEVYTGGRYVCLKYDKQCLLLTGLL